MLCFFYAGNKRGTFRGHGYLSFDEARTTQTFLSNSPELAFSVVKIRIP